MNRRVRRFATAPSNGTAEDLPAWVISLGRSEALRLTAYGVLLLFLGVGVVSAFVDVDARAAESLLLIGAFFATMVVHELVHGLCFWLLGGSPTFGAGATYLLPYLYTTSDGDRFDTRQMSIIGMAPLMVISAGTLLAAVVWPNLAPYAVVGFLANLSGSVGDMWLVGLVWRFAELDDVRFEDRRAGVAVWTDDEGVAAVTDRLEGGTTATRLARDFLLALVALLVVTIGIGVFAALMLPASQAFRIGPAMLPLFEKHPTTEGVLVSISFVPPVVGALVFAGMAFCLRRRRWSAVKRDGR